LSDPNVFTLRDLHLQIQTKKNKKSRGHPLYYVDGRQQEAIEEFIHHAANYAAQASASVRRCVVWVYAYATKLSER
jgi:hypothetical protein